MSCNSPRVLPENIYYRPGMAGSYSVMKEVTVYPPAGIKPKKKKLFVSCKGLKKIG